MYKEHSGLQLTFFIINHKSILEICNSNTVPKTCNALLQVPYHWLLPFTFKNKRMW